MCIRDRAYKFCGHLTILDSGQALTTGETKKLFERPGILQAARLTGCKNFSAVQKMGEHNIYAVDWDLMLQTKDVVPDDVTHVGIRGHWMKGSSEGGENRMEVEVVEYIETTFEHQYLLKNKKGGDCQPVWWMLSLIHISSGQRPCNRTCIYFLTEPWLRRRCRRT